MNFLFTRRTSLAIEFLFCIILQNNAQSNSYIIEGYAQIKTWYYDYDDYENGNSNINGDITYYGPMTAEIEEGDNGTISITLRNVCYQNPTKYPTKGESVYYSIGDLTYEDIIIDSKGNIPEDCFVNIRLSAGEDSDKLFWEGEKYGLYSGVNISGSLTSSHKLNATFQLSATYSDWYTSGEYGHQIKFMDTPPVENYRRSVVVGNYGTIVLPFSPTQTTGIAHLYSIKGKQKDAAGNLIALYLTEESSIKAGVPYIFVSNAEEITASTIEVTDWASVPYNTYIETNPRREAKANNGLQGTFKYLPTSSIGYNWEHGDEWGEYEEFVPYTVYLISNNKVIRAGRGSFVDENRAYILMDYVPVIEDVDAEVRDVCLYLDSTTGLQNIDIQRKSNFIYDMSGQKVKRVTRKGIYIVNGRKVVY